MRDDSLMAYLHHYISISLSNVTVSLICAACLLACCDCVCADSSFEKRARDDDLFYVARSRHAGPGGASAGENLLWSRSSNCKVPIIMLPNFILKVQVKVFVIERQIMNVTKSITKSRIKHIKLNKTLAYISSFVGLTFTAHRGPATLVDNVKARWA